MTTFDLFPIATLDRTEVTVLLHLKNEGPRYRRVYNALREAILAGQMTAGTRLPGSRRLARDLGFSRIVVLAAYEQLAAEGYIDSEVGSGSRIAVQSLQVKPIARRRSASPRLPALPRISAYARRAQSLAPHRVGTKRHPPPARVVDFEYASHAPDARTLRLWRRCLAQASATPEFAYPDPAGFGPLRQVLATYLHQQRGVVATPDQVLIVSGSQQALDLAARALCDAGDSVGIEDPHYQGMRQVLIAAGAQPVPCAVGPDGFDIDQHAPRLRTARAVFVTPSHQFPSGAVMSAEHRLRLLNWAGRNDAWIVEDDYDCEFRHGIGAIPALQGLDGGRRVIYVGTFARTLFPGVRLGFVIAPAALVQALRAMKWLADRGSSALEQRALASFIESGAYESSRRRLARALDTKRELLLRALPRHFAPGDLSLSGSASGIHVFLRLPRVRARDTNALIRNAARRGVCVYSGLPYFLVPPSDATLLLGYGAVAPEGIEAGVRRLAAACRTFARARKGKQGESAAKSLRGR